ncbi:hypothetical protein K438DRAFT_2153833 [Mycena galopus ATCC 62051]|nr:hypothetical protein K438DRAFT_2153833 [Mycena galopus ATCC 62051]
MSDPTTKDAAPPENLTVPRFESQNTSRVTIGQLQGEQSHHLQETTINMYGYSPIRYEQYRASILEIAKDVFDPAALAPICRPGLNPSSEHEDQDLHKQPNIRDQVGTRTRHVPDGGEGHNPFEVYDFITGIRYVSRSSVIQSTKKRRFEEAQYPSLPQHATSKRLRKPTKRWAESHPLESTSNREVLEVFACHPSADLMAGFSGPRTLDPTARALEGLQSDSTPSPGRVAYAVPHPKRASSATPQIEPRRSQRESKPTARAIDSQQPGSVSQREYIQTVVEHSRTSESSNCAALEAPSPRRHRMWREPVTLHQFLKHIPGDLSRHRPLFEAKGLHLNILELLAPGEPEDLRERLRCLACRDDDTVGLTQNELEALERAVRALFRPQTPEIQLR